jgi:hypothetical protein
MEFESWNFEKFEDKSGITASFQFRAFAVIT